MTINRQRIAAVVFALTICGTLVSRAMGQQTSAPTTQPLRIIKYDGDMATMLAHLTRIYDVTIGFEVDSQQPKPQVGFYVRDATLTDVLNAIIKSAARYQWREIGGFIEVLPLEGSSQLLDTPIRNFRVKDVEAAVAIDQLVKLPEVQASMKVMSLNHQDLGNASTERNSKKFSISLEGVTMRQALSRVAKENGTRFWIFRRDSNGFFSINSSPR